jgi:hypothetical protein
VRARNIKPGFFKNELLAECDPLARILFEGLWAYSDREGRFEWRPRRIKAEILPYDECDIESLLKQLVNRNFIVPYSINGNNYGYIPTFLEHQKPHIRETQSTYPAPTKAEPRQDLGNDEPQPRKPSSLNPSSLNHKDIKPEPSAGFSSTPSEYFGEDLEQAKKLVDDLSLHFKEDLWPWIGKCIKKRWRADAVLYALGQLWEYRADTKKFWPYLKHVAWKEHQNANEADAIRDHEKLKQEEQRAGDRLQALI